MAEIVTENSEIDNSEQEITLGGELDAVDPFVDPEQLSEIDQHLLSDVDPPVDQQLLSDVDLLPEQQNRRLSETDEQLHQFDYDVLTAEEIAREEAALETFSDALQEHDESKPEQEVYEEAYEEQQLAGIIKTEPDEEPQTLSDSVKLEAVTPVVEDASSASAMETTVLSSELHRNLTIAMTTDPHGINQPQTFENPSKVDPDSREGSKSPSDESESGITDKEDGSDNDEDDDGRRRRLSPIVFDRASRSASPSPPRRKRTRSRERSPAALCRDEPRFRTFFEHARFFIIKSGNMDNVLLSKQRGVWSTTPRNEALLNRAFRETKNVILIFSVERSQAFQGFCRMASEASHSRSPVNWVLPPSMSRKSLGGVISVHWVNRQELPFVSTHHLQNPWNENKPVRIARDGTEVAPAIGRELCYLFNVDAGIDLHRLTEKVVKLQQKHPALAEKAKEREKDRTQRRYSAMRPGMGRNDGRREVGAGPRDSREYRPRRDHPDDRGSPNRRRNHRHQYGAGQDRAGPSSFDINGFQSYDQYISAVHRFPTQPYAPYAPVPLIDPYLAPGLPNVGYAGFGNSSGPGGSGYGQGRMYDNVHSRHGGKRARRDRSESRDRSFSRGDDHRRRRRDEEGRGYHHRG